MNTPARLLFNASADPGCLQPGRSQVAGPAVLVMAGLTVVTGVAAQAPNLDRELAAESAQVITVAGREYSGLLDGLRDGRLHLRRATDGGEVGYSFAPDEIAELAMPGEETATLALELWEREDPSSALPMLEAIGRQRVRYLPVLNAAQRRTLVALVEASAIAGNPYLSINYAERLLPFAADDGEKSALRDARLEASVRIGDPAEVQRQAEAWCGESDPGGSSALGWRILARQAFDEGDFDRAHWVALQPVVFSSFGPMEGLEVCYALAISAADRLGRVGEALELFREMIERGIAWPDDPGLAAAGEQYRVRLAAAAEAASADVPPTSTPDGPPQAPSDPGNSLEQVRRLVTP